MPLILGLALGRQKQEDLCEFKISLVYKVSSRTARVVTQRNPVSKKKKKRKEKERKLLFISFLYCSSKYSLEYEYKYCIPDYLT